jgi:hypothetical protein
LDGFGVVRDSAAQIAFALLDHAAPEIIQTRVGTGTSGHQQYGDEQKPQFFFLSWSHNLRRPDWIKLGSPTAVKADC